MTLRHNIYDDDVDLHSDLPLFPASHHHDNFDALSYLRSFYTFYDTDPAMHKFIVFMPSILSKFEASRKFYENRAEPKSEPTDDGSNISKEISTMSLEGCGEAEAPKQLKTFLDIGCGPCLHTAMYIHPYVDEIYLADYAPGCRDELQRWLNKESQFNWKSVGEIIYKYLQLKGRPDHEKLQDLTREKVRGIYACDVNTEKVIIGNAPYAQYDIVSTSYCLEAATESHEQYRAAFKNVASLVAPGGYMIIAGVCSSEYYVFDKMRFKLVDLDEDDMKQCFADNGFDMDELLLRRKGGVAIGVCRKLSK